MTIEEIFSNLATHMAKGLMIHSQLSHGFGFLNLRGYQKCHEYHYFEESHNYHNLHNFYLTHCGKLIEESTPETPQIFPPSWHKYDKSDVDAGTRKNAIKDFMKKWIDWEKETKDLLAMNYKELVEQGHIDEAIEISKYLRDVSDELAHAREKYIDLEAMNYDMSQIVAEQQQLFDLYKNKLHEDDDND